MPDTRAGPKRSRAIPATAAVLAVTSLFLLASLGLAIGVAAGNPAPGLVSEVLAAPGRFLLDAFSWAAFFVPAYLLAGMTLLLVRGFRRRWALMLVLSILPFLTVSLILHVLRSSDAYLSRVMLTAFGRIPSAVLLFLLLALELMLLLTLPRGFGRAAGGGEDGTGAGRGAPAGDADLDAGDPAARRSRRRASRAGRGGRGPPGRGRGRDREAGPAHRIRRGGDRGPRAGRRGGGRGGGGRSHRTGRGRRAARPSSTSAPRRGASPTPSPSTGC